MAVAAKSTEIVEGREQRKVKEKCKKRRKIDISLFLQYNIPAERDVLAFAGQASLAALLTRMGKVIVDRVDCAGEEPFKAVTQPRSNCHSHYITAHHRGSHP